MLTKMKPSDDLDRHYAQHGLKDPEGYFDSDDEEVQQILSQSFDAKGVESSGEVDLSGTLIARLGVLRKTLKC